MNVLVTGAAGFLGSHLVLRHLKQGDTVLGIDNFISSNPNSGHVKAINSYMSTNRKGMLLRGDISAQGLYSLDSCVSEFTSRGYVYKFDRIYNFACPASPPQYQKIPVQTMLTCVAGTNAVLELAKNHGSVVVHASTSEIYGDPKITPQHESYRGHVNSYGPRSCYDEGKRAAEALCYDYLHTYKVDARLVRIFNTYGPHMDPADGRVISNMLCQAIRGKNITVYGDGTQTRSFCYASDLIDAIVLTADLKENPNCPINIGNPKEFSIKELANLVISKFEKGTIEYKPLPVDDPLQRKPDISFAKKVLNWEPKVQLEEGLDKTIEYFSEVIKMRG